MYFELIEVMPLQTVTWCFGTGPRCADGREADQGVILHLPLIQEGLLSVTSQYDVHKVLVRLTFLSSLSTKKVW